MKRMICAVLAVLFLAGMMNAAFAEKGFETLYELYCSEDGFGRQPMAVYDMVEGEGEQICLVIFLFDPDNDMTEAILIGADAQGVNRYYVWVTDYEPGSAMMVSLIGRFAEMKEICGEDVDFCISFTFDGGETMTDIATAEEAEDYIARIEGDLEEALE